MEVQVKEKDRARETNEEKQGEKKRVLNEQKDLDSKQKWEFYYLY